MSPGGKLNGSWWCGTGGRAGLELAIPSLFVDREEDMAKGGYGFLIGDGALNFGPETITEAFYSSQIIHEVAMSLDYQFVLNPAYNWDRGPVHVFAARVHTEL